MASFFHWVMHHKNVDYKVRHRVAQLSASPRAPDSLHQSLWTRTQTGLAPAGSRYDRLQHQTQPTNSRAPDWTVSQTPCDHPFRTFSRATPPLWHPTFDSLYLRRDILPSILCSSIQVHTANFQHSDFSVIDQKQGYYVEESEAKIIILHLISLAMGF